MEEPRGAPAELDPSFGDGGIVRLDDVGLPVISTIAVEPNGRILVVGSAEDEMVVARFLPDGALDTEFGGGTRRIRVGETPVYLTALVVLGDGRILVGGSTAGKALLLRLTPSGDRDATFGTDGVVVDPRDGAPPVYDVALDATGRIVVAGATDDRAVLTRYQADGSPDVSFGASGIALPTEPPSEIVLSSSVGSVIVQQDGSIVAGGGLSSRVWPSMAGPCSLGPGRPRRAAEPPSRYRTS